MSSVGKTADLLILSPWDLNKLGLKVVHPFSCLLQVLFHPFTFAFVITIHLDCDHLGVTINNHNCGPYYFSEIQSYH